MVAYFYFKKPTQKLKMRKNGKKNGGLTSFLIMVHLIAEEQLLDFQII